MEFKGRSTDPFEQLITETLDEQLGSPPSAEVWKRIAEEISTPPSNLNKRARFASLLSHRRYHRVCSTLIVLLLLMLVAPQALQQWNQPSSLPPRVVPTKLPYSLPLRPVPESDLRPTEKQAIPKGHAVIEQEQPAQLGMGGLGARGEVIFSSVIQAKRVIQAPNQNNILGSKLDKIDFESYVGEKERACPLGKKPLPACPQPVRRPKQQPDNKHIAA